MTHATSLTQKSFPSTKQFFWILALLILFRIIFYLFSHGFSLDRIENTFPVTSDWKLTTPTNEEFELVEKICTQKFQYLGKGSQVYAFQSQDGQYVLKLFKCYHLKPVKWIDYIPLSNQFEAYKKQQTEKRNKKIVTTLKSYKISYHRLRDECGLVSLQILPAHSFHQKVHITDRIGRDYSVDLGNYGYIIQKKAELIYPSLEKWIAEENYESAKQALQSVVALIVERSRKGIQDSDPDLHKNAGLIGEKAIFIDLGSFHENKDAVKKEVYANDLHKITNALRNWLNTKSPTLARFLDDEIAHAETSTWQKP